MTVFVPGTHEDPGRDTACPQSARSDVGWAANATPNANTAAAINSTFLRYILNPPP